MVDSPPSAVSPEMMAALQDLAAANKGIIPLDHFIECALYHPSEGYYMRDRERVGRSGGNDFYTATSLGPLFAELVLDAIKSLVKQPLSTFTFIEIGPETRGGLLGCIDNPPFRECRQIRKEDPLDFQSPCVVYSNELFDAQPFRRFIRKGKSWKEAGVVILNGQLEWITSEPFHPLPELPKRAPEDYTIDWPSAAHSLMEKICQAPWKGLFLALDYGLDRSTILEERPEGTGRSYSRHRMGNDLLLAPGRQDITCHLIWDQMQEILQHWEFENIHLQRQEAFFMHHSEGLISRLIQAAPPGFSRDKQTLMELIHPDNMGHKFQALHASRGLV
jgi:SAM-dependent MidA family methyltransferase